MINFTARIKNKTFWLTLIPAVLLLVQVVAAPFGYQWDFGVLNEQLAAIINALFAVLAILGIVTDPTTAGVGDSAQALTYTEPKRDEQAKGCRPRAFRRARVNALLRLAHRRPYRERRGRAR